VPPPRKLEEAEEKVNGTGAAAAADDAAVKSTHTQHTKVRFKKKAYQQVEITLEKEA
jgi:hypothetical protein